MAARRSRRSEVATRPQVAAESDGEGAATDAPSRFATAALLSLAFSAIALGWLWPLPSMWSDHSVNTLWWKTPGQDAAVQALGAADVYLIVWELAWGTHALLTRPWSAFFDANMDLCAPDPVFNLYNDDWPVFTSHDSLPPAKISRGAGGEPAHVDGSLLCAGSIDSPRLLMLSGIGPAAALRAHGIAGHCGTEIEVENHALQPDPEPRNEWDVKVEQVFAVADRGLGRMGVHLQVKERITRKRDEDKHQKRCREEYECTRC